jgi:hypothetical protein
MICPRIGLKNSIRVALHPRRPREGHHHEYHPKKCFQVDVVREGVSLGDISHQFQNFLNAYLTSSEPSLNRRRGRYTARTAHRCPGYNRIEITLTANITHSAIVSHSSPIPCEICPVCKEVVKDTDVFNCICGGDGECLHTCDFLKVNHFCR